MEKFESYFVTDGRGHHSTRGGIVQIAPRRGVGEKQVVANELHEHVGVAIGKTHPRTDSLDNLDPHFRVIAGMALTDVVEETAK